MRFLPLSILASLLVVASPGSIAGTGDWDARIDLRIRHEHVDDQRFEPDADALTARLRLSLISPDWSGWRFGLAAHGNRHLAAEDFNSTANGRDEYPVVADPDDEGLSEAWLAFRAGDWLEGRVGRQRIIEDNARFIGNVGFRQLEQTFDAVSLGWRPGDGWQVDLRWLDRAHRVFGPDHPDPLLAEFELDAWVVTATRTLGEHAVSAYGHRLAFDDRPASHRNFGLRATGPVADVNGLAYRFEYARQQGIRERDAAPGVDYWHARIEQNLPAWHWFAAHERLGGDGDASFQTPLATLHAHNGWSDQFLVTPADGLADTYLGAGAELGSWKALAKVHDFRAERGSRRYGNEYGLMIARPLNAGLALEAKLAHFDGQGARADVTKLWLTLNGNW